MASKVDQVIAEFVERLRQAVVEDFVLNATGGGKIAPIGYPPSPKAMKEAREGLGQTGGKRTQAQIEATKQAIFNFLKKHPGSKTEQIAAGLEVSSKELQLPMAQLREEKAIKMKGQRRAATYTASKS